MEYKYMRKTAKRLQKKIEKTHNIFRIKPRIIDWLYFIFVINKFELHTQLSLSPIKISMDLMELLFGKRVHQHAILNEIDRRFDKLNAAKTEETLYQAMCSKYPESRIILNIFSLINSFFINNKSKEDLLTMVTNYFEIKNTEIVVID